MKLEWRHLRGDEDSYELVFGLLGIPFLAAASLVVSRFPGHYLPPCWLNRITGMPCPTCGAYRSLRLVSQGRLADAWLMQPLGVSLAGLAVVFSAYSVVVTIGRLPRLRLRFENRRDRWLTAGAALLAVVANWVYLVTAGR